MGSLDMAHNQNGISGRSSSQNNSNQTILLNILPVLGGAGHDVVALRGGRRGQGDGDELAVAGDESGGGVAKVVDGVVVVVQQVGAAVRDVLLEAIV